MLEDDLASRRCFSRYMVGSYVEGTHITDSDHDILYIWENVTICQNVEESHRHDGAVFLMERSNSPPGYTKLKLVEKQNAEENILIDRKSIEDVVEKTDMGKYLSNTKVIECFAQYLREKQLEVYIERNGPCVTAKNVDLAQGFELCSITDEGNHWLDIMDASEMERIWPSPLIIEKIKTLKCHVVAVGGPDQCFPDSSLNMRCSYTLWEKELVSSFHDVQFFCFLYLKMLNRKKLKKISKDVSSFHIKNVVFWESIECSQDLFQFKNLRTLIKECLVRLQTAVKKKRLSHFIDRDRNLFESKLQDENDRQNLIQFLDNAEQVVGTFNQIYKECMEQICSQNFYKNFNVGMPVDLNQKLRRCEAFLQKGFYRFWSRNIIFEKAINDTYAYYVRFLKVFDGCNVPDDLRIWFGTDLAAEITIGMNKSIEWISDAMEKVDADQETLDMMKKNILFRFGISAATFRIYWDKKRTRQQLQDRCQMEDAFICQKLNQHTDALSGLLYLCTYYVQEKRFLEANSVMDDFLKSGPKLLLYIGECSTHNGIHVENGIATYVQYENIPLNVTDDPFPYVDDMKVFEGDDTFFFPPIVQIQILLQGTFFIDPIVYLYFLKVVCDVGLKKNADNSLKGLRDTVFHFVNDKNKFRHLNLLAYAFQLTERYDDANGFLKFSIACNMNPLENSAFYLNQGADLTAVCEKLALLKFEMPPF